MSNREQVRVRIVGKAEMYDAGDVAGLSPGDRRICAEAKQRRGAGNE